MRCVLQLGFGIFRVAGSLVDGCPGSGRFGLKHTLCNLHDFQAFYIVVDVRTIFEGDVKVSRN